MREQIFDVIFLSALCPVARPFVGSPPRTLPPANFLFSLPHFPQVRFLSCFQQEAKCFAAPLLLLLLISVLSFLITFRYASNSSWFCLSTYFISLHCVLQFSPFSLYVFLPFFHCSTSFCFISFCFHFEHSESLLEDHSYKMAIDLFSLSLPNSFIVVVNVRKRRETHL